MVYLYSTIKMMHGPINLRFISVLFAHLCRGFESCLFSLPDPFFAFTYLLPFLPGVMLIVNVSFCHPNQTGDACGRQNAMYIKNCYNPQYVVQFSIFYVVVSKSYLYLSPLIFFYFSTPFLCFVPVYLLLLLTP